MLFEIKNTIKEAPPVTNAPPAVTNPSIIQELSSKKESNQEVLRL